MNWPLFIRANRSGHHDKDEHWWHVFDNTNTTKTSETNEANSCAPKGQVDLLLILIFFFNKRKRIYLIVVFLKYVLEACISNHEDLNADLNYLLTKCTMTVQ